MNVSSALSLVLTITGKYHYSALKNVDIHPLRTDNVTLVYLIVSKCVLLNFDLLPIFFLAEQ